MTLGPDHVWDIDDWCLFDAQKFMTERLILNVMHMCIFHHWHFCTGMSRVFRDQKITYIGVYEGCSVIKMSWIMGVLQPLSNSAVTGRLRHL